jgi:predicted alternative tryptophan synthase beta-subunit
MADARTRFLLDEDAIPTHWVNLVPDLPGDPEEAGLRVPKRIRDLLRIDVYAVRDDGQVEMLAD